MFGIVLFAFGTFLLIGASILVLQGFLPAACENKGPRIMMLMSICLCSQTTPTSLR